LKAAYDETIDHLRKHGGHFVLACHRRQDG